MIAYIFAICLPGLKKESIKKIRNLPNVVEVNAIMGDMYDILIKVHSTKEEDLHYAIRNIRDIPSLTSTVTFPVITGQDGTEDVKK
ncbi:MAG: Lrp/AsnC ligand binding domain-containing protein [Nitrosopumilaceae archaeon]